MKQITFDEAQKLLKSSDLCRNGHGVECVVSTSVDKIIISWKNTFYEFLKSDNLTIDFCINSIGLIDTNGIEHSFFLYNIVPVKI